MDKSLKRIFAFIIDSVIVSFIVALFVNVTKIDPYMEKYEESYNEYVELVKEVQEEGSGDYEDRIIELNYDIYKYRSVNNIISVVAIILYFGVVPFFTDGQTPGKKLFKLKIVSNNDKTLNIGNYLIRVIILNNVIFSVISIITVYFTKGINFYYITYVIGVIESIIYIINVLMIVFRNDSRGLHDMLAKTKVVDLKGNSEC